MPRVPEVFKGKGWDARIAWIGLPGFCLLAVLGAGIWMNQSLTENVMQTNAKNSEAVIKLVLIAGDMKSIAAETKEAVARQAELEKRQSEDIKTLLDCVKRKPPGNSSGG